MNKLSQIGAGLLLLTLTSCGTPLLPYTVPMDIDRVEIPETVNAGDPLTVKVHYTVANCSVKDHTVYLASRTASTLTLSATMKKHNGMFIACNTGVWPKELTYTDPGTPTRTNPFEVIINGKSWGKVKITNPTN